MCCHYYESFDHDACNCPYRAYVDAKCASVEKTINEFTDKMVEIMKERIAEYSQSFTQSRENCCEPDFGFGFPNPDVCFYDDFEPSYFAKPNLNDEMPLPS